MLLHNMQYTDIQDKTYVESEQLPWRLRAWQRRAAEEMHHSGINRLWTTLLPIHNTIYNKFIYFITYFISHHGVSSVTTALNLTPVKRDG